VLELEDSGVARAGLQAKLNLVRGRVAAECTTRSDDAEIRVACGRCSWSPCFVLVRGDLASLPSTAGQLGPQGVESRTVATPFSRNT